MDSARANREALSTGQQKVRKRVWRRKDDPGERREQAKEKRGSHEAREKRVGEVRENGGGRS